MLTYPYQFLKDLAELKNQAGSVGWHQAIQDVIQPDASPSWQFTKYLFIGIAAVLIFYAVYGIFRILVESAIPGSFTHQRLFWNLIAIFIAFVPTNAFTYRTNRRWVFVNGRHAQKKEFLLFTTGAGLSFLVSQLIAGYLIVYAPVNDFFVTLSVIIISTIVNFLFRKFWVFHR